MNFGEQASTNFKEDAEKGAYYKNKKEYRKSLEAYASALEWYFLLLQWNGRYDQDPDLTTKIDAMFTVETALMTIATCYYLNQEPRKAFVWAKEAIELLDILKTYERFFTVKQMKLLDSLSDHSLVTEILALNAEEIQSYEIITDESFNKIKKTLEKISDLSVSLLPRRENSSNNTTNDSCFIATAVYSTAIHPDIDTFRQFRDENLLTHVLGKKFVHFYYKLGPIIAQYIEKQPAIKGFLRQHLAWLAEWIRSQK